MSEKLCCNCLHCARWQTSKGIECHCDLDDRYLGFITVMSETECERWEHETKWELAEKHDAEVRAGIVKEIKAIVEEGCEKQEDCSGCPWDIPGLVDCDVFYIMDKIKKWILGEEHEE